MNVHEESLALCRQSVAAASRDLQLMHPTFDGSDAHCEALAQTLSAVAWVETNRGEAAYARPLDSVPRIWSQKNNRHEFGAVRPQCEWVESRELNNWGGVQAWNWTGDRVLLLDSSPPDEDEGRDHTIWYAFPFRKYPTPQAGYDDLLTTVVSRKRPSVMAAALSTLKGGSWRKISETLKATKYYEGMGATVEHRIQNHWLTLSHGLYLALPEELQRPTLKEHKAKSFGPSPAEKRHVTEWQAFVKARPDGAFGPRTTEATKAWQRRHSLTADGVVGGRSWAVAIFGG